MTALPEACPTCGQPPEAGLRLDGRVQAYVCKQTHAWGVSRCAEKRLRAELIAQHVIRRAYAAAAERN